MSFIPEPVSFDMARRLKAAMYRKAKLRAEKMLNGAATSDTGNAYGRSNSYHGISTDYIDTNTEKMK